MTPGIGLAVFAMISFGAGDLIYKRAAAAGIEARHFLMLQAWFFCPLVTLYALARQKLVLEPAALWGSLAGLVMFFAFYNFSRSLRSGSISANAPIFRLNFTLTAALAIGLLGEPLTLTKLAGLGLAFIAVLALAGGSQGDAPSASGYGSLTRVLLATVAAGSAICSTRWGFWRVHRRKRSWRRRPGCSARSQRCWCGSRTAASDHRPRASAMGRWSA